MPEATFRPDWLKARREALNLTLNELAAKANVPRDDIANAEAGRVKKPRYWFMVRVAEALDEHPDSFFENTVVEKQEFDGGPSTDEPAA